MGPALSGQLMWLSSAGALEPLTGFKEYRFRIDNHRAIFEPTIPTRGRQNVSH
jgi:hypothetical protein